jgi:hypothetical protein
VNEVATPKLPPPPCSAQNSSGCSSSLARTVAPSAMTSSTASRLSQASPIFRSSQPVPPPRVNPPTPVVETLPPVVARPYGSVARSRWLMVAPPATVAVRASGSTVTACMRRRSTTRPPSGSALPATLWPPPRTPSGRPVRRPKRIAAATSSTRSHWAITAGRRSIMALKIVRASS